MTGSAFIRLLWDSQACLVYKKRHLSKPLVKTAPFRYLFSGAIEIEFDQLGRIFIPEYLRTYANLKKEIIFVGVLERVEIWDKTGWDKMRKRVEAKGEEIAEKLSESGV